MYIYVLFVSARTGRKWWRGRVERQRLRVDDEKRPRDDSRNRKNAHRVRRARARARRLSRRINADRRVNKFFTVNGYPARRYFTGGRFIGIWPAGLPNSGASSTVDVIPRSTRHAGARLTEYKATKLDATRRVISRSLSFIVPSAVVLRSNALDRL